MMNTMDMRGMAPLLIGVAGVVAIIIVIPMLVRRRSEGSVPIHGEGRPWNESLDDRESGMAA